MAHVDPPTPPGGGGDIAALLAESQALRTDVHVAEAARKRQNAISTAILVVLTGFVLMALVLAWQGNRTIAQTRETNQRIADCTSPGGQCYRDGQARTGAAIQTIMRVDIYVAECAQLRPGESGAVFDKAIEQCVAGRLAAAAGKPVTPPASPSPSPAPSPTR